MENVFGSLLFALLEILIFKIQFLQCGQFALSNPSKWYDFFTQFFSTPKMQQQWWKEKKTKISKINVKHFFLMIHFYDVTNTKHSQPFSTQFYDKNCVPHCWPHDIEYQYWFMCNVFKLNDRREKKWTGKSIKCRVTVLWTLSRFSEFNWAISKNLRHKEVNALELVTYFWA